MDFKHILEQEMETERIFLRQYVNGKDSTEKYCKYRLSKKSENAYYAVNKDTGKSKYLSRKNYRILHSLRKRKLCESGIKVLERNLKALERLVAVYKPYDPDALEESLSPAYRTSFGLIVRSRIEAAAAELAYSRGYYIMYEKRVILYDEEGNLHVVYPDFILCENEESPDVTWIYWEHLGLLDMEDYRERTMLKLKLFPQNGILPGQNLILTTDGMNESIDLMAVSNVLDSIANLEVVK